ncbi:MAG: hypothetical protein A2289_03705 [Deltaproteobacteria bacterium RIFOXYA12_FULL_58_15]|nr:MAG: hypothetical protein A2289_03705 [Deltaproteobacteria bacterium RIFOXYA12_FULL_58_15]
MALGLLAWTALLAAPAWAQDSSALVITESMSIRFSTIGAVPISWDVIDPRYTADPQQLFDLKLGSKGRPLEVVVGAPGLEEFFNSAMFKMTRSRDGEDDILRFESPGSSDGLVLIKTYRIPARGFALSIGVELKNMGTRPTTAEVVPALGLRLGPGLGPIQVLESGLFANFYKYVWPIYQVDGKTQTLGGLEPEDGDALFPGEDKRLDWLGIHNRFFMMAVSRADESAYTGRAYLAEGLTDLDLVDVDLLPYLPTVELSTPLMPLEPHQSRRIDFVLYAGPKIPRELGNLDVMFVGSWLPMRWICHGITRILDILHALLRSWGLAIIALALVIRMVLLPLYWISLKSQAKTAAAMAIMKPKFAEAKQRLAADPLQRDEAILLIYKEHGISPFGSLFGNISLVIQIPIFIALFKVVGDAYALQGASFLWISDLSQTEKLFGFGFDVPLLGSHFNLLPVLMTATQLVSSALSAPPSADRKQVLRHKLTMVGIGLGFFVLFYSFPSGLVLYWWMATLFASIQQRWITKRLGRTQTT